MKLLLLLFLTIGILSGAQAQPFENVRLNMQNDHPTEPSIAINPMNPDNVVGAGQSPCRFYVSFDGGSNWGNGYLNDQYDLGDPALAFDAEGTVYYCYIGLFSHSGIFINRSDDGGASWWATGTPVVEHNGSAPFEDKSYHCCDLTDGPYSGNVYVCWTRFSNYGSHAETDSSWIYFSKSTDKAVSFSEPMKISDRGGNAVDSDDTVEGTAPGVGPDGEIYVAWSGPRGIEFDRSTDGGETFGVDRVISNQPGGWDFAVPGIFRSNGFPVTRADISHSLYRGRIYVCWSDQRNLDTDVFLITSDDGGETWSDRVRVNNDLVGNGAHQFFPWIDVDPITGYVYVVFYDRRAYAPASTMTDVYLAISQDGGATFQNIQISESPFDPNPGVFFGDYNGISAYNGRIRPIWTRMVDDARTIWTALIDFPTTGIGDIAGSLGHFVTAPNPTRSSVRIYFGGTHGPASIVRIFDVEGRLIRTLIPEHGSQQSWIDWDGRNARGASVGSGTFFISAPGYGSGRLTVTR